MNTTIEPRVRQRVPDIADTGLDVVTGAFSYSGNAIARALLASGRHVRTITGHPERAPRTSPIDARPLDFDDPLGLVEPLKGATTLYNTYWVRFAHDGTDHDRAVANSRTLFHAARRAGVRRIVHVRITHPSIDSPFPYFRGKALVERALMETELSYAILRPAILFGGDGVLLNNIAWLLRHVPVFAVGGHGEYRVRGIHVDDLGLTLRDVLLTRDEYRAMAAGLADTDGPATGSTALSTWLAEHSAELGLRYANELHRHFEPGRPLR